MMTIVLCLQNQCGRLSPFLSLKHTDMLTQKANSSCDTQDISFAEYTQQDTGLTQVIQIHRRSGTVAVSLVSHVYYIKGVMF